MADVPQPDLSALHAYELRGDRPRARDAVSRHCGGAALRVRCLWLEARATYRRWRATENPAHSDDPDQLTSRLCPPDLPARR